MRDPKAEGSRWLDQAENDLAFARHALEGGYFHQVCFISHQASEIESAARMLAAVTAEMGGS